MKVQVEVKQGAYLTSLLHALKYPSASVNGVLLGQRVKGDDGQKIVVEQAVPLLHAHLALAPMMDAAFALVEEHCKNKSLKIVGYYHANATHDQNKFAGAPISPAMAVAKRIADRIYDTEREADKTAESCAMIVDNKELEIISTLLKSGSSSTDMGKYSGVTLNVKVEEQEREGGNAHLSPCLKHPRCDETDAGKEEQSASSGWQQVEGTVEGVKDGTAQAELLALIKKGAHRELTDFDNHLDDASRGWLTTSVVA